MDRNVRDASVHIEDVGVAVQGKDDARSQLARLWFPDSRRPVTDNRMRHLLQIHGKYMLVDTQ
jgi:hypothetical protein